MSAAAEPAPKPPFAAYLAGLSSWFVAFGIQTVMFPWLAAVVLRQPPLVVGLAQMALMAPSIVFMLWGGAVADRGDPRSILLRCHLLAAAPPLAMAVFAWQDALSLPVLLAYGVAIGTIGAFAVPARDGLLPAVVGGPIARAVALATGLQFLNQLAGILVGWFADRAGAATLLVLQAAIVAAGALAAFRLPRRAARSSDVGGARTGGMREGLVLALRSQAIWPVLAVMVGIGLFYVGTFMVALPVAVRDVYGRGSDGIAAVSLAFWGGTIVSSFGMAAVSRRVSRPGLAMLSAVSAGVLILLGMSTLPAWPVFLGLCFAWGLGAGVSMTQGRTIVQIAAAPEARSRMLALFQLGFMGGGPVGALAVGLAAQAFGVGGAMAAAAAGMAATIAAVATLSGLARHRAGEPGGAA